MKYSFFRHGTSVERKGKENLVVIFSIFLSVYLCFLFCFCFFFCGYSVELAREQLLQKTNILIIDLKYNKIFCLGVNNWLPPRENFVVDFDQNSEKKIIQTELLE